MTSVRKKTEAVNAYLIKSSEGEGEKEQEKDGEERGGVGQGGRGASLSQAVGRTGCCFMGV